MNLSQAGLSTQQTAGAGAAESLSSLIAAGPTSPPPSLGVLSVEEHSVFNT